MPWEHNFCQLHNVKSHAHQVDKKHSKINIVKYYYKLNELF